MSDDSFTEVSSQSWFDRIKESIKGVLIGIVLFIVAFPLLWWNEGRAVKTAKSLAEGAAAVVSASPDKVDSANEGKLVHLTGKAVTDETLTDTQFGVSAVAIQLARKVEMYQWKENQETETERQTGGSKKTITTYTYEQGWAESRINSSNFKEPAGHQNPSDMPFHSAKLSADKVALGAFSLSKGQIGRISDWKDIPPTKEAIAGFPEAIRGRTIVREKHYLVRKQSQPSAVSGGATTEVSGEAATADPAEATTEDSEEGSTAAPGNAATGNAATGNPGEATMEASKVGSSVPPVVTASSEPQIGDLRVSFSVVEPTTVSLIAAQMGDSFGAYQTQAGDQLDMLKVGPHSAESMFEAALASNRTLTWILRLVGFLVMFFGVSMVFKPLVILADVLPLLGDLLRMGTGVVAFAIAAPLSLLTIAIAWVRFRPLLGISLIAVAVALVVGIVVLVRKKKAAGELRAHTGDHEKKILE